MSSKNQLEKAMARRPRPGTPEELSPWFPIIQAPREIQEATARPHFLWPRLQRGQPAEAQCRTGGSDIVNARPEFSGVGQGRRGGRLDRLRFNFVPRASGAFCSDSR